MIFDMRWFSESQHKPPRLQARWISHPNEEATDWVDIPTIIQPPCNTHNAPPCESEGSTE